MAKIDDIVRLSGVSRSTVFRFLNGSNVRAEAKKAIMQAMEDLNYKTDAIYKQQNIVIEISASQSFETFKGFIEVVEGITQRADEKGIKVQIVRRGPEQIQEDYDHWNDDESLKGVIVVGKNICDEEKEAQMILAQNIPHVFVNRIFENPDISYVAVDLKKAAYEMVEYLINKGHENIAVMGYPKKLRLDRNKLDGYLEAYQKRGMEVSNKYYRELEENESWEKYVKEILQESNRPTAFFGICDSYAMKFTNMARSLGVKVPEDIAVVGMDDLDIAEYFKPSLTTVHSPFKKMGIVAVDSLLQLLTNDDISSVKTIIKHSFIKRESCGKVKDNI